MRTGLRLLLPLLAFAAGSAFAATFSTLITTPLVIEGLTSDGDGNLQGATLPVR